MLVTVFWKDWVRTSSASGYFFLNSSLMLSYSLATDSRDSLFRPEFSINIRKWLISPRFFVCIKNIFP